MDSAGLDVVREQICEVGRRMFAREIVAANDGNISVKVGKNAFLVTPNGASKGFMSPDMILLVDQDGALLEDSRGYRPTSELKVHFAVFQNRPDVGAVIHAHPLFSCIFAADREGLRDILLSESALFIGTVPVAQYHTPGSVELAQSIVPFLARHSAILMGNHGAVAMGEDLKTAYFKMETLEFTAKVAYFSRLAGMGKALDDSQLKGIIDLVKNKIRPAVHPFL